MGGIHPFEAFPPFRLAICADLDYQDAVTMSAIAQAIIRMNKPRQALVLPRVARSAFEKVYPMTHPSALCRAMLLSVGTLALTACLPSDGEVAADQPQSDAPSPAPAPVPAPAPPPAPTPAPAPASISVSWNANTEADLHGYRVYYGTASGAYQQTRGAGIEAGRNTSFTISNLKAGTVYYIAVTAYDTAGNESAHSGEVSGPAR
ncbi:MAG: hypothetical protein AMXMBFR59_34980 [Rhodanobacteraceae bacterium]|jgi:hypothetical protein